MATEGLATEELEDVAGLGDQNEEDHQERR